MNEKNKCSGCEKEFLIIKPEMDFYKRKKLPLPSKCSECRRARREGLRNKWVLYDRQCDKCGVDLQSTYSGDSKYKVYCETCYWDSLQ